MKLILSQYRGHYKTQDDIAFALKVLEKLFEKWEYKIIEKALFEFMTTDTKGFPPVPGQLIEIANRILLAEIREKDMETAKLEMPKSEMPERLRQKINEIFKEVK